MRPAKLGRNVDYATSDPGHVYIPGVTETWLGSLAAEWGIEGKRATREERVNLYAGRTPDGSSLLRPNLPNGPARPMIGGNYFPGKSVVAWLAGQSDAVREKGELILHRAAVHAVTAYVLPNLPARTGHAGRGEVAAQTIACAFGHVYDSLEHYNPHTSVEILISGRCKDGEFRGLKDHELFPRQLMSQTVYEAEVVRNFYQEFGLKLTLGPTGLEVKGLEKLRDIRTPRQEEIDAEVTRTGLPNTPGVRHEAARATHRDRKASAEQASEHARKAAVADAVEKTRAWLRQKGIEVRAAVVGAARKTSELVAQKAAEMSVVHVLNRLDRIGRDITAQDISTLAVPTGGRFGIDPARIERVVASVTSKPEKFGLARTDAGTFTTPGIELNKRLWSLTARRLERKKGRAPKPLAMDRLRLAKNPPSEHEFELLTGMVKKRLTVVGTANSLVGHIAAAYRHDQRRVHVVGGERTAGSLRAAVGRTPETHEDFAHRLKTPSLVTVPGQFIKERLRSLRHMQAIHRRARRPPLRLEKKDLLIVDARGASHRAMRTILQKAAKAKASVVLIHDGPIEHQRARGHDGRGR